MFLLVFQYVRNSMQPHFFSRENKKGGSAREIFEGTNMDLIKETRDWLSKTCESCSFIAALIATVAYASSLTVPGGLDPPTAKPILENKLAFNVFTVASFLAFSSSVTALVFFLAILNSKYKSNKFSSYFPKMLLIGLTSLFMSIISMLISFCCCACCDISS